MLLLTLKLLPAWSPSYFVQLLLSHIGGSNFHHLLLQAVPLEDQHSGLSWMLCCIVVKYFHRWSHIEPFSWQNGEKWSWNLLGLSFKANASLLYVGEEPRSTIILLIMISDRGTVGKVCLYWDLCSGPKLSNKCGSSMLKDHTRTSSRTTETPETLEQSVFFSSLTKGQEKEGKTATYAATV